MQKFWDRYEKYASWMFFLLMLASLIVMAALGFYNHPLGDDFHYGYGAAMAWKETGNIFEVLKAAWDGVLTQYQIWQGTYSAMFLMHLSPQVFGDFFYKLYPTILFACFTGAIFYLMHVLLCVKLKASRHSWILVSSLLVLVCIMQVPLCGETFYWYNGSMYYTGFYACTCVFWGFLIKSLDKMTIAKMIILSLLAFFIAGGNYISLLPTMIIMGLMILYYIYKVLIKKTADKRVLISLCIIFACLAGGFLISALAPGNAIRQATSWKIEPLTAIWRSIYQNTRYVLYWNGIWSLLFFLFITPVYMRIIEKCKWKFRCPILVCGLIFGIYCSTSCPPFYAQNNGGAARVFCLVYYMMMLTLAMMYFYALGALYRFVQRHNQKKMMSWAEKHGVLLVSFVLLIGYVFASFWRNDVMILKPNTVIALECLCNGDAEYYEKQYQDRVEMLKDETISEVVFEPYDVPNALVYYLYVGDISTDETNEVNQKMAEIYGKKSIRVDS